MARPLLLTAPMLQMLAARIRLGAFAWVAAESAGISRRTFYRYMQLGERGDPVYVHFYTEVCRARAEARFDAESRVFAANPALWLRKGPGRERQGEPGWSDLPGAQPDPLEDRDPAQATPQAMFKAALRAAGWSDDVEPPP